MTTEKITHLTRWEEWMGGAGMDAGRAVRAGAPAWSRRVRMAVKEPIEDREVDRCRRIPMSKEPQSSVLIQLQDEREMLRWTPLFLPPLLPEAPRETTELPPRR